MKNQLAKSCWGGLLAGAMLLAGIPVPEAHAQNTNLLTANVWDCTLNGQRQGTAYFQFNPDGTFNVIEIIVPNAPNNSSSSAGRGGSGTGRSEGGSTNIFVPNQQIFGDEETNGFWAFDPKGRVIGFFVEISEQESCVVTPIPIATNALADTSTPMVTTTNPPSTDPVFCVSSTTATNVSGGSTNYSNTMVCFTNATVCTAITNSISFIGSVSSKRLVLKCTTTFGNTTYEGVPFQKLPDISGRYSGVREQSGATYQEFLTLTNSGGNIYDVSLTGPGYTYAGISILSSQKKLSMSLGQVPPIPTNQVTVIRAVTGPFNPKKTSANMRGWDQSSGLFVNPETFNIERLSP